MYQPIGEHRLWRAVIEEISQNKGELDSWMRTGDFVMVCTLAGLDANYIRRKIRAHDRQQFGA